MSESNLKDIKVKIVTLKLDKERHLLFDINAFIELEEKFGDINTAFENLKSGSIKTVRTLLWVALIHEDENLTEKEVGSLFDINNLIEVTNALNEALTGALPDSKNSKASPTKKK